MVGTSVVLEGFFLSGKFRQTSFSGEQLKVSL